MPSTGRWPGPTCTASWRPACATPPAPRRPGAGPRAGARGCPPYETEYGRRHGVGQAQGLADIAAFYNAFGLTTSAGGERVDHVSAELEFLAVLAPKEALALGRAGAALAGRGGAGPRRLPRGSRRALDPGARRADRAARPGGRLRGSHRARRRARRATRPRAGGRARG